MVYCVNVIHIRRVRRTKIVAEIDWELLSMGDRERRRILERRLREPAVEVKAFNVAT